MTKNNHIRNIYPVPSKKDSEAILSDMIRKVVSGIDLTDLNPEQLIQIATSVHIDNLKSKFVNEVRRFQVDRDKIEEYKRQWLSSFSSKHTRRSFERNIEVFLSWLGNRSVIDVDSFVADQYFSFINSEKTLKNNSKRQRIASCGSFFSSLERWDVVEKNPFKKAKGLPKKEISIKTADQIPTKSELDIIEEYALSLIDEASEGKGKGVKNKYAGNVLGLLSLRILRIEGLRVGALKTLKIDRSGNYTGRSKGKTVYGRFNSEILKLIDVYGLSATRPFSNYSENAFSSWYWRLQKKISEKLAWEKTYSPHSIRHRFAIDFYERTKDIVKLSERLNHSSIAVTSAYLSSLRMFKS